MDRTSAGTSTSRISLKTPKEDTLKLQLGITLMGSGQAKL
jgi:hypothetical protein